MEKTFKFYLSGIHLAEVNFTGGRLAASRLNVRDLTYGPLEELADADLLFYRSEYTLDLAFIRDNYRALSDALAAGAMEFEVAGQLYRKHADYPHVYAGRRGHNPADILYLDGEIRAFIVAGREWVGVLVQAGYEKDTPWEWWNRRDVSPAVYPVRHLGQVMAPMRDGVRLASDIWLPEGKGRCDCILVRTPYGRLGYKNFFRYVMRGYAVCVQDVRGRGDSEGEWIPKYHETNDGSDTLDFIAGQSWSSGRVGMLGASYLGCAQWSAAASGNPHLKALVSIVASGDPFTDLPRKGGAFVSGMMAWAFSVKDRDFDRTLMERSDWGELVKLRPLRDIPRKVFGGEIGFWSEWCRHECYDAFWENCNWYARREHIKTPALIVSGWYDDNGMATSQALEVVENYPPGDKKVVLGAWMHNCNATREIHGVPFGDNCVRYDLDLLYQLWFDRKLGGIDNGVDRGEPVEYYLAGENRWRKCQNWPPEQQRPQDYFLSCQGKANGSGGDGRLLAELDGRDGFSSYQSDPNAPPPHLIDISENEICVPENYCEVEKRADVLIYTSDPLTEDLPIAGEAYVEFYAASSALDTDFVVRLTDVDPTGRSIRLCDGLLRAKFRHGFDRIELLTPGQVEKYRIRTTKIAWTLPAGHRLRLQITSGAENYIFPNPNTGANFFADTLTVVCTNSVHHGGRYPSRLTLPVLYKA